jgi:hypothetical protein
MIHVVKKRRGHYLKVIISGMMATKKHPQSPRRKAAPPRSTRQKAKDRQAKGLRSLALRMFMEYTGVVDPRLRELLAVPSEQWTEDDIELVKRSICSADGVEAYDQQTARERELLNSMCRSLREADPLRHEIEHLLARIESGATRHGEFKEVSAKAARRRLQ